MGEWKPLIRTRNNVELGQVGEYKETTVALNYIMEFRTSRRVNAFSKPYRFFLRRLEALSLETDRTGLNYSKLHDGALKVFIVKDDIRLDRWRREVLSLVIWTYSKYPEQGVDLRDLTDEGTLRES